MQTAVSTAAATPRVATPRRLELVNISPSGMTPPAKRPLDRASIHVANTGERPLSHEELTAGFYAISRRLDIEEAHANGLRECSLHHANLLDAIGRRSCEVLASANLINHKVEQMEQGMLKLEGAAAEKIAATDQRLRDQIDAVMQDIDQKLKAQHATLSEITSAVASQASSSSASSSTSVDFNLPDLARQLMQCRADLEQLKVDFQIVPKMQEGMAEIRLTVTKAHETLRSEVAQAQMQTKNDLEQYLRTQHNLDRSSPAPAAAPAEPQRGADPMQYSDAWQQFRGAAGFAPPPTSQPQAPSGPAPPGFGGAGPGAAARDALGRWRLYDEKVHLNDRFMYNSKKPEV